MFSGFLGVALDSSVGPPFQAEILHHVSELVKIQAQSLGLQGLCHNTRQRCWKNKSSTWQCNG
eukprot:6465305-Amphidinium_carterae.1